MSLDQGSRPASEPPVAQGAEAAEAAQKLSFIQEIIGRTKERDDRGNFIPLWCAGITLAALGLMWALALVTGRCTSAQATAIWLSHNVLLWAGALLAVRRSGQLSVAGRQIIGTWAVATVAIWAVVGMAEWTGAVAPWATWPVMQLVFGLALAFTALVLRNRFGAFAGAALAGAAPLVAALGPRPQAYVGSGVLVGCVVLYLVITDVLRWRRFRAAPQQ